MRLKLLFGLLLLLVLAPDLSRWSSYLESLDLFADRPVTVAKPAQNNLPSSPVAPADGGKQEPQLVSAAIGTASDLPDSASADIRVIVAKVLNLREGPSSRTSVLGKLPNGTKVTVVEVQGNWLRVESEDGQKGWVSARFVAAGA